MFCDICRDVLLTAVCFAGMVLVRSENGQLLMIPQQALAQMQAQAHAQSQPQNTLTPRPATPTSAPPVQISTVQVSPASCAAKNGFVPCAEYRRK